MSCRDTPPVRLNEAVVCASRFISPVYTLRLERLLSLCSRLLSRARDVVLQVTRDRLMVELHEQHPLYGFAKHKGYATKAHREAIMTHGPCIEHRWSFAPVKSFPPLR